MIRRLWQTGMIRLARSPSAKRLMQQGPAASVLAARYVAGATAEMAVSRAAALHAQDGIRASLFYLGEYVDRADLVAENLAAKLSAAEQLGRAGLDVHVSVDPTQIGHSLDPALARRNAFAIAERVAANAGSRPGIHALMLDIEDETVVDATIALHTALVGAKLPAALTLQAYLRRTETDLAAQIACGSRIRLVKGAFAAGSDVAFTRQAEIKASWRRLVELMFSRSARASGFYPIIATHDDRLQAHAIEQAEANGWRAGEYEFEMLLGVRADVALALARLGHRVRLYLPFGRDWWPYAIRRIGENPRNAVLLARSLAARAA